MSLEHAIFNVIFYMTIPVMLIVSLTCVKYLLDKWIEQND
jgi:hypothetical protein